MTPRQRRERAIAKLAELTDTPAFVVRAAFDEYAIVVLDEALAGEAMKTRAPEALELLGASIIAQLVAEGDG